MGRQKNSENIPATSKTTTGNIDEIHINQKPKISSLVETPTKPPNYRRASQYNLFHFFIRCV